MKKTITQTEVKHTPLPYELKEFMYYFSIHKGRNSVARIKKVDENSYQQELEDATFIVKACNSHYTLLEALKEMVSEYEIFADVPENYKELKGSDGGENPRITAIIKAKEAIKQAE